MAQKVKIKDHPSGKCKVTKKVELKQGEDVTFESDYNHVEVTIPDKRILNEWRFDIYNAPVTKTVKADAPLKEFEYVVICFDKNDLGEGASNPKMKIKD